MAIEPYDEQDATWSAVMPILVEVREMAVSKEDAVQSIKDKLGLHDSVLSLLLQLCRDQITVDDVKERLFAAVSITSFGGDGAPVDEEAINSLLSERLRSAQVTKRTAQIKKAMGVQDTVQQVVEEVERGNMSVLSAVKRLRELIIRTI
ncbi:hypothetical protein WN944_009149 [Citrus x changshan-huyou]|uniref:Uncharacterized protein n=1 Tax=Citrus x changshan-huyou TaxID=2935761 RepID=A0AAP0MPC1_9ROSI